MSLLSVLRKAKSRKLEDFIAPIIADRNDILLVQDGLPTWVHLLWGTPGWYMFRPRQRNGGWTANYERHAFPHEYMLYLDALPRFYVLPLYRLDEGVWAVMPYSIADAHQRGWAQGVPRPMHLVRDSVRWGDVVEARVLGDKLLYGQVALRRMAPAPKEYRMGEDVIGQVQKVIREKQEERARREKVATLEGQLEDQVAFMGGQLLAWKEVGESIEVLWEWKGHRTRVHLNRDLTAKSIGFCTAGTIGQHNLASAVALLQEGVRQEHYAVQRLNDLEEDDDNW